MLMDGDIAGALGDLARDRWAVAGGKPLPPVQSIQPQWPDDVPVLFENVDLAIARTRAP